jgi:hypothetical protein
MDRTASNDDADRDALYKVAYDEAVRALSDQRLEIDSVHSRTGLLLSVAAVATSFLGARALEGGSLSPMSWLALASFIVTALVSLAVFLPSQEEFSADAREVIETYIEAPQPVSIEGLHRDLALHMHASYARNLEVLGRLATLFQMACGLLIVEMIFWVLSIPTVESHL